MQWDASGEGGRVAILTYRIQDKRDAGQGGGFSLGRIDCEATFTRNVGDRERSGMEILKVHRECNS